MTYREFLEEVDRAIGRGHRYIQLQARRRSRPKNWDRVRVFPGVYGRCIGETDACGIYLIDVPIVGISTPTKGPAKETP